MPDYSVTFTSKRLWLVLGLSMALMFSVLLLFGQKIYHAAPPIPERVLVDDGSVVFTGNQIRRGQNVWQALGGMQQGSVWGHGSYLAPDWSADWLHREALALKKQLSTYVGPAGQLSNDALEALAEQQLRKEMRGNTYNTADILPME